MSANISYKPTPGLSYDPQDPTYWSEDALKQEMTRVFEVCHGCRMCFKYCDSFPSLFSFIDDRHDGDVLKLTDGEIATVMDQCFQCKLCEVQCPYTPRDGHEFELDFPKLVHRYQAQRVRREGLSLRDKALSSPDRLGRVARASMGMANLMNRNALHRWFLEKVLGIHRAKDLPEFAPKTFERWAREEGRTGAPGAEVVLFQTCFVQNNDPGLGRDTLEVFARNSVEVRCVEGLQCCGMPAWEHGDLDTLQRNARVNLDLLLPHVRAGAKVIALQPSCTMLMRREWPELVAREDRERARELAEAMREPGEVLWDIRTEDRFNTDFKSSPRGIVHYHAPCHLRAQGKGFRGRDLLRKLPEVTRVQTAMECCGHDGTYAMKVEGFEPSVRIGAKAAAEMREGETRGELWVTDCPLAALQFRQLSGRNALHPMTVLARAYRGESFWEPAALPGGRRPLLPDHEDAT